MPIEVICTVCGGTGKKDYLVEINPRLVWEEEVCSVCKGKRTVTELTWQEKKEAEKKNV